MRTKVSVFATLWLVALMAAVGSGAGAEVPKDSSPAQIQRTEGDLVGASIVHPAKWLVEREPYTYDGTYGYTLWRPESGGAHDHGGTPAVRVALAYELEPSQIEGQVQEILAYYEDELPVGRSTVSVGVEGHRGVAVGPIPGSTPSTEVYVPVNGRVYRINLYAEKSGEEGLDADDEELLAGVRFDPPTRTVRSLALPEANAPEALYPSAAEARAIRLHADAKAPPGGAPDSSADESESLLSSRASGGGDEQRIAEGCWRADPQFFVQTQHGYKANAARGDNIPTGWSPIGIPNFWGQYTHGNFGYGRCTKPNYTNDKFAVDYPLNKWDYVFSPFACGRVTHAGRNRTHADYGIFVSIKACNGKYVNLTGHLAALRNRLNKGDRVTRDTVIGYAGKTGGSVPVGRVHIHTAFYRNPQVNRDGSPYGGAGLQIVRNHYVGTAAKKKGIRVPRLASARVYEYAKIKPKSAFCREGIRCGERYNVSN
ncbi:MAG: M23 family metallopeptidase [Actinomycetota bacterium]|nr:M23 family metallopeptidase [Actinomycetota bacterium]